MPRWRYSGRVYELIAWLEASALAGFPRGLGIRTYGIVKLLHILGIDTLLGSVLLLTDSVWRRV